MQLSSVKWWTHAFPPSLAESDRPQDTSKRAQTEPEPNEGFSVYLHYYKMVISEILTFLPLRRTQSLKNKPGFVLFLHYKHYLAETVLQILNTLFLLFFFLSKGEMLFTLHFLKV